mgnify:CR=1 FL=1
MLCERATEVQQDLYITFIDYRKAFVKVKHKDLLKMLQDIGIDDKELRLRVIRNLYLDQTAAVSLQNINRVRPGNARSQARMWNVAGFFSTYTVS